MAALSAHSEGDFSLWNFLVSPSSFRVLCLPADWESLGAYLLLSLLLSSSFRFLSYSLLCSAASLLSADRPLKLISLLILLVISSPVCKK